MAIPMVAISGAFSLAGKVADIISEAVEDKDLAARLNAEIYRVANDFAAQIQTSEHVPGYVKFLYAVRDVIIPLLRPLGGAMLSAYAVYAAHKGVAIDPVIHGMLAAAFPGWMASRHVNKQAHEKTKQEQARIPVAGSPYIHQ